MSSNPQIVRLQETRTAKVPWRKWGPYLSERQWGTVREDYSRDGNAWDYFTHDQARSRAYHWGEHRLAGISDARMRSGRYPAFTPTIPILSRWLIRTSYAGFCHQTGWTGVVAKLIELFGRLDADKYLQFGKSEAFAKKAATA